MSIINDNNSLSQIERIKEGEPGTYKVTGRMQGGDEEVTGEYNTVCIKRVNKNNICYYII